MTFAQKQERKQEVFAQALAKLKETRQLSTDLLKPLAIPFENFLRFGQLSAKKQQKTMTSLIAHLEKCAGLPIAYDVE
tara:strand:+ start:434 stop:667 length:234 start_codon:yes stop_codon:yes gene_type:complete